MDISKQANEHENSGGSVTMLENEPQTSPLPMDRDATAPPMVTEQPGLAAPPSATGWQRQKRITGLWSKNEDRNSWVAIQGVGWKKLASTSDSASIALTLMASQALQTNRLLDYREDEDGIHEIYLW